MKNIVIIGGGTGTFTLLSGLKKFPARLSVVVSSADDGGSTGILRKELGVLPPGDIRQCLLGLSKDGDLKKLFAYRFCNGSLAGHNAGNIVLSVLEKVTGSAEKAIAICAKMLKSKGKVIPATLKPATLVATLEDGSRIIGEHNIDEPKGKTRPKIKSLKLLRHLPANPQAIKAIREADIIVFGPGDLYTSILPNLLVKGIRQALEKTKARKVYITNIMTKHGQTEGFKASDFVKELSKYLGNGKLDVVVINDQKPSQEWLKRYNKEGGEFVWPDVTGIMAQKVKVVADNFLADYVFQNLPGDGIKRSLLRHNAEKTAKLIWRLAAE